MLVGSGGVGVGVGWSSVRRPPSPRLRQTASFSDRSAGPRRSSGKVARQARRGCGAADAHSDVPAFAQMEFSGEWAPVQDGTTPAAHVGEFIGIPMSRAGSLRTGVGQLYAARVAMPAARRDAIAWAVPGQFTRSRPISGGSRPIASGCGRSTTRTHGRPAAPSKWRLIRGAASRPVFEGEACDYDDPSGRITTGATACRQRSGDADAILDSARRLPDLGHYCLRPAVSLRADDSRAVRFSPNQLPPCRARRRGSRASGASSHHLPAQIRFSRSSARSSTSRSKRRWAARPPHPSWRAGFSTTEYRNRGRDRGRA